MKTKDIPKLVLAVLLPLVSTACGSPEQKFEVTVKDEEEEPIKDAECRAWFKVAGEGSRIKDYSVTEVTDTDGSVELQGETVWGPTVVETKKAGYYSAKAADHWTIEQKGDRWTPWPVKVDLVLKKIRDPKPMYAAKFDAQQWLALPDAELGPLGFDLEICDWVKPYGKGVHTDFILEGVRDEPPAMLQDPKGRVILTFANEFDGIAIIDDSGGSQYVGPTVAPDHGYSNRWEFKNWEPAKTRKTEISRDFSDEAYVFRVRTKVDSKGRIVEARYGKLDGRIKGWLIERAPGIMFTYYLAAKPNERGLEWDMKNNLFSELPQKRWPRNP